MKKLFIVFLLLAMFGCNKCKMDYEDIETSYHTEYSNYDPDYNFEIEEFCQNKLNEYSTFKEKYLYLIGYVKYYIKYIDGDGIWQTPIETHNVKIGDCADKGVYFAYLINKYLDVKIELWSIRNFVDKTWHIIGVYNNLYFGFEYELIENNDIIYLDNDYLNDNGEYLIRDIYDYGTALYYAEFIK